jgi:Trp operon repressor
MCEYGFDLDFREGNIFDQMLTDKEREGFWRRVAIRLNLLNRKN